MFLVTDSINTEEQIGKAEVLRKGFKVKIFNGEAVYYLKQINEKDSFRVFKCLNEKIVQETGRAHYLDQLKTLIAFNISGQNLAYIKIDTNIVHKILLSEGGIGIK